MKVLIIDDEPKARKLLTVLVEENCPKVTHIFTAEDLLSGVEIIKNEAPQIVFLDIEMPEHSGLELLDFVDINVYKFEIIFTTAYSEFAIQAFKLSAIDYLLKPIRGEKIREAVEKAEVELGKNQINTKLEELKHSLSSVDFTKIGLPVADGIKFANFHDIIMLKADGMYTTVFLENTTEILISKPLKHFVDLLYKIPMFYKPHRSYLINLKYIQEYSKKDGGYIIMDNNECVSISKDNKEEFLAIVQNIG